MVQDGFYMMTTKTVQIQPKKSYHFWWYIIGILLIPVLAGIYILYKKISELSYTYYQISDQSITAVQPDYTEKVDIVNINEIKIHQRWIDKKLGIGNLILKTNSREVELIGLENPENLSNLILKAAEAERLRIRELEKEEREKSLPNPGTLDRMDYLTGLWQQGLITNKEFNEEKKHFGDN